MSASLFKNTNTRQYKNLYFGRKIGNAKVARDVFDAKVFPAKTYVVVDTFDKKNIDIEGDGTPDLSHGEFICKLIKSLNPNAVTLPFKIKNLDSNEYVLRRHKGFIKYLKKVKPDGINRSLGDIYSFQEVNVEINRALQNITFKQWLESMLERLKIFRDKAKTRYREGRLPYKDFEKVNNTNFVAQSEWINWVLQQDSKCKGIISILEEVSSNGFKLYNAGGNDGNKHFAIECLADGVDVIGSTDAQKNILSSSADVSTMKFAQGIYGISEVKDANGQVVGYDIVGNGKVAIKAEEVSSKGKYVNPVIEQYSGKPLQEFLIPEEKYTFLKEYYETVFNDKDQLTKLQHKWGFSSSKELMDEARALYEKYLMTVDQVEALGIYDEDRIKEFRETGKYKRLFSDNICFDVDKDGLIIYDPEHSGRKNVINYRLGSSYATPAYMTIKDIEIENESKKFLFEQIS